VYVCGCGVVCHTGPSRTGASAPSPTLAAAMSKARECCTCAPLNHRGLCSNMPTPSPPGSLPPADARELPDSIIEQAAEFLALESQVTDIQVIESSKLKEHQYEIVSCLRWVGRRLKPPHKLCGCLSGRKPLSCLGPGTVVKATTLWLSCSILHKFPSVPLHIHTHTCPHTLSHTHVHTHTQTHTHVRHAGTSGASCCDCCSTTAACFGWTSRRRRATRTAWCWRTTPRSLPQPTRLRCALPLCVCCAVCDSPCVCAARCVTAPVCVLRGV